MAFAKMKKKKKTEVLNIILLVQSLVINVTKISKTVQVKKICILYFNRIYFYNLVLVQGEVRIA